MQPEAHPAHPLKQKLETMVITSSKQLVKSSICQVSAKRRQRQKQEQPEPARNPITFVLSARGPASVPIPSPKQARQQSAHSIPQVATT